MHVATTSSLSTRGPTAARDEFSRKKNGAPVAVRLKRFASRAASPKHGRASFLLVRWHVRSASSMHGSLNEMRGTRS